MNYERMYYHLFNAITDALEELERNEFVQVKEILVQSQQETEEMYLEENQA